MKFFGFGGKKGLPSGPENKRGEFTSPYGYHIEEKDLGKIHRAVTMGKAAKVRQILLLRINGVNDRDKMNRPALYSACADGNTEEVNILSQSKILLNLVESENRTALIKAVQCQEEECATILLERGADPNVVDADGNTALHHAVLGHNTAIVAKLLAHKANAKVINKDGLTPLSLAVGENTEDMEVLFIKETLHMKPLESNHQQTPVYKTEGRPESLSESSKSLVDEKSEEDSLGSLSSKLNIDDSWPTSEDED